MEGAEGEKGRGGEETAGRSEEGVEGERREEGVENCSHNHLYTCMYTSNNVQTLWGEPSRV